jgi:uncharacterized protein
MGMDRELIGRLTGIARFPVKSMAGEDLGQARIEAYGVYGDRSHAFIEDGVEGWDRYLTAREMPSLLTYHAALRAEVHPDELGISGLQVTSPEGKLFEWNEELLQEIQPHTKRSISLLRCQPDGDSLMAVDTGGILIITDRTLRRLEDFLGYPVDLRRFRANLVVALEQEIFMEDGGLIGHKLLIGDAVIEVTAACERCMMITLDPDTLARDPRILKKVNEEMGLYFGVYASVVQTGDIRAGIRCICCGIRGG